MARDLAVSPTTLERYLEVQALYIVFVIQPCHRNIARALLQSPKLYFHDSGLVKGDDGARFGCLVQRIASSSAPSTRNAVAGMLLKHADYLRDTRGAATALHYVRTKDGAEVDFCLGNGDELTHLVECKLADAEPHRALVRFAVQFPTAEAVQLVHDLRQPELRRSVHVVDAADWLSRLAA